MKVWIELLSEQDEPDVLYRKVQIVKCRHVVCTEYWSRVVCLHPFLQQAELQIDERRGEALDS